MNHIANTFPLWLVAQPYLRHR